MRFWHFAPVIQQTQVLQSSQVTFWSPEWRSLNPWKGHLQPPKVSLGRAVVESSYDRWFSEKTTLFWCFFFDLLLVLPYKII